MLAMNRILYAADCLDILNDEAELPNESVDLIYLDPPFNSNSNYNLPFRRRDKSLRPVRAFKDTWEWTAEDDGRLAAMEDDPRTRALAGIVRFAQEVERVGRRGSAKPSLAAYLLNMALRLRAMRRVLKPTGSIYLHCDPTASHYLKLVMDAVFGKANFRNELVWHYFKPHSGKRTWPKNHDTLFFYTKGKSWSFEPDATLFEYDEKAVKRYDKVDEEGRRYKIYRERSGKVRRAYMKKGRADGVLRIPFIQGTSKERLGYPTQKPLALLERIIRASSEAGDLVLDPFCGCGTTVHAAEALGRRWVGIDISPFSTGLIRERLLEGFRLPKTAVVIRRAPQTVDEARALAQRDKFEFEKWVCGLIGAEGMFHDPGTRGADGGVDGLLKFYRFQPKKIAKAEYAVVQVKGGKVSVDAVRALRETVDRLGVSAGVLVCFEQHLQTVNNQRSRDVFQDVFGSYPVIQGYSIEALLADVPLDLPMYGYRRKGAALD